jgi:hypothetical protein
MYIVINGKKKKKKKNGTYALGCDAWSRSLGCGCERYPGFRVEEDKC